MTELKDDFEDPELRAGLRRATAPDRPSAALRARVEAMARMEAPARDVNPAGYRPVAGEFSRELFPRLVGVLGILSLLVGILRHFSLTGGLRHLAERSGSIELSRGPSPALLSSAFIFLLFPLVTLLFVDAVSGGRFLKRWIG